MKDIKCALKECKFNRGYCCCSKQISINNKTDCVTYSPDEKKRSSSFESSREFIRADYSVDTSVSCNADCLFNKNGKCYANGITVSTEKSSANCLTFVKK